MAQQDQGPQGTAQPTADAPREFNDIKAALAALDQWRQHAFVCGETALVPIPPMHRVAVVVVKLDVWWEDGKPWGDDKPYAPGGGKPGPAEPSWALSNATLEKLGSAAGIDWPRVKVTERCAEYVTAEATGTRALLDGTEQTLTDQYTYDIEARAEQARAKAEKWFDPKKAGGLTKEQTGEAAYQKTKVEDRVHAMTKATSGAKSRVIERLLRMKRGGFRVPDLQAYPFVFLKLVPAIDYENDPQARAMLLAKHTGLAKLAFGMGQQFGALDALAPHEVAQLAPPSPPTSPEDGEAMTRPARTDAPPTSAPAPVREGAARDALRKPPTPAPADDEPLPWDQPKPAAKPAAPQWPTLEVFREKSLGEQTTILATLLRDRGQAKAAAQVEATQVEPDVMPAWYDRALKLAGKAGR